MTYIIIAGHAIMATGIMGLLLYMEKRAKKYHVPPRELYRKKQT